jgi:hypothetical protein
MSRIACFYSPNKNIKGVNYLLLPVSDSFHLYYHANHCRDVKVYQQRVQLVIMYLNWLHFPNKEKKHI